MLSSCNLKTLFNQPRQAMFHSLWNNPERNPGPSSSIQSITRNCFVVRVLCERPQRANGCEAGSLLVSMEEMAEYKSSALFYECLFTMLGWNFLKSTAAFALNLSLKLQCWFLSCKWSCFPIIFFLSTRLLSMSKDVNLKHMLYGAQRAYWKERSLFNEKW